MTARGTTRRAFLANVGLVAVSGTAVGSVLAACGDVHGSAGTGIADDADDDIELVRRAIRDGTRLAARYDALLPRHKPHRGLLTDLRADVRRHLDVLRSATSDSTTSPPTRPAPPSGGKGWRRQLAQAEANVGKRRRRDATAAESGDLARLFAAMAASHAQHQAALGFRPDAVDAPITRQLEVPGGEPALEAMNRVLAGEHAAVYAYGVIGGRLDVDSAAAELATDALLRHRRHRDALIAILQANDAEPVDAEVGYRLPTRIGGVPAARRTAQRVEDRCAVLYATLAATATGDVRALAVDLLAGAAVRAADWGGPPRPFPGVSGRLTSRR